MFACVITLKTPYVFVCSTSSMEVDRIALVKQLLLSCVGFVCSSLLIGLFCSWIREPSFVFSAETKNFDT